MSSANFSYQKSSLVPERVPVQNEVPERRSSSTTPLSITAMSNPNYSSGQHLRMYKMSESQFTSYNEKPKNVPVEKQTSHNFTAQNRLQSRVRTETDLCANDVNNTVLNLEDGDSRYASLQKQKTKQPNKSRSKMSNTELKYSTWNERWRDNEGIKSSNDLTSAKWETFAYKNYGYSCNSSESDIFPSRSIISTNPNEIYQKPTQHMVKSSSSTQLPHVRSSSHLSSRTLRLNNGSNGVLASRVPPPAPVPVCANSGGQSKYCSCQCHHEPKKMFCAESMTSLEDAETPEGLSWRRLHMSRAKLKATSTTSELLSGFAMVAMVELQVNSPTDVPEWLFVLFAVCTTVLVSVHIFALMISTYLLPNIDAVSKLHVSSMVTESPHDRMKTFIELAWAFSTILGLFLFLVEIAIVCWVKFWDFSFTAAMSATMIVIPVLIVFVAFAMHFYHSLVVIKCKTSVTNMNELENMKKQLDTVSPA